MGGGTAARQDLWGASVRRLFQVIQEGPLSSGLITGTRPPADPKGKQGLLHNSFQRDAAILHGVITDVSALANCYRVQLDRGHIPLPCVLGDLSSNHATGARSLTTLQVGTRVVVLRHPRAFFGTILAAINPAQMRGKKQLCQQITHSSRNRVDDVHKQPHRTAGDGHIPDWLAGRPFDATHVGEQGWIAETGMRIFMDPFMAMIGLNEGSSLTAFYHDALIRLAAYNYKHFTAGVEHESLNDQGEICHFTGYTPYPWEQNSKFERGNAFKENPPQAWQVSEPHYGPVEPQDDKQRPWHRELEFHGYLGQGFTRLVQTKPTSGDKALYTPDGEQPIYPGLFKEFVGLDGSYCIQSAKRISITKQIAVLTPARAYPAEQTKQNEGDSPDNYRAAGHPSQGSGPEHKITGELTPQGTVHDLERAAGMLDLHAYLYNYATVHPFFYHEKDWTMKNEGDLEHIGGVVIMPVPFPQLASQMFLKADDFASPRNIKIDHRDKFDSPGPKYYQTKSGIDFLEDGGVVLSDGYGGEIRMTGGSVFISAPGDVWLKSGRTAAIWGGDDVVVRAKNSMDLTCTEKDLRLKAEKNIQILAGNSGEVGGVLIESRAKPEQYNFDENGEDVKSAGVMLRSQHAPVLAWAKDVYLRSGPGGADPGALDAGDIILDAGRGQQKIITHSDQQEHYTQTAIHFAWGAQGNVEKADRISKDVHDWCSMSFIDGGLIMNGGICSTGGHLSTQGAFIAPTFPFVIEPDGEATRKCEDAIENGTNRVTSEYPDQCMQEYKADMDQKTYQTQKKGNDKVITDSVTSLRTVKQYGTENEWKLWEDRWQQMARITGEEGPKWPEKPVVAKGETYPYPGKENFDQPTWQKQDLEIYDLAVGSPRNRGEQPDLQSPYDDPKYAAPQPNSLHDYIVIR